MARGTHKLSALDVQKKTGPGYYGDGGGLWLRITDTGTKSWMFRYMQNGRARYMGLGPVELVPLKEARQSALEARRLLFDGVDPIEQRRSGKATASPQPTNAMTFRQCAEKYIAAHEAAWKNPVHRAQWRSSLENYCYAAFGDKPIATLDTAQVMAVLEPIWPTKTETAKRTRGRIEAVWDWAKVRGHCHGENPARWRGHLQRLLPAPSKVRRVKHHAALAYTDLPALMRDLDRNGSMSAYALRFTILTAARTGETIGAHWTEFDLQGRVWTVPGERMKSGRPHRVPLSDSAVAALQMLDPFGSGSKGDYVFPGANGAPLSNMAMAELLKGLRPGLTVHGFRSSFKDWATEVTDHARDIVEAALAHIVGDKVEAAYRRGDALEKRRALMADWADFCRLKPAEKAAA
jgi:integrase